MDLAALHAAVVRRGGFQAVSDAKAWRDVCRAVQVRSPRPPFCPLLLSACHNLEPRPGCFQVPCGSSNTCYTLRQIYAKHLLDFEERGGATASSTGAGHAPKAGRPKRKADAEAPTGRGPLTDDAAEAAEILGRLAADHRGRARADEAGAPKRPRMEAAQVRAASPCRGSSVTRAGSVQQR